MKQIILCTAALCAMRYFAFAQSQNQTPRSTDSDALANVKRAIDKGNAQWSEGWAKGDAAAVSTIFAPDGVQLTGNGKIFKGPEEIAGHLKAVIQSADPGVKVTVKTLKVWLDGDTAYESGSYKYEYTQKGKPGSDEGLYVTIWKRQADLSWKLAMDMGVPKG
jgi:uncharacterized protein (TIGR02246 family)